MNGRNIPDKNVISEEFNNFIAAAGTKIFNSINPTCLDPNNCAPCGLYNLGIYLYIQP